LALRLPTGQLLSIAYELFLELGVEWLCERGLILGKGKVLFIQEHYGWQASGNDRDPKGGDPRSL
jgi:hypothetical protein